MLKTSSAVYHSDCYKEVTNVTNLNRAKSRAKEPILKRGRPSIQNENVPPDIPTCSSLAEPTLPPKRLRSSKTGLYNKSYCIICQIQGGILHQIAYETTGKSMLQYAELLQHEELLLRLNSISDPSDGVANDTKYHLLCWNRLKKQASKLEVDVDIFEQEEVANDRVLGDIEIINIVDNMINNYDFLDMNSVNITYKNLINEADSTSNYKKYLKGLLQENIPNISFSRPLARRESEVLCSDESKSRAINSFRNAPDDYHQIFQVASNIRNDILKTPKWFFTGSFGGFKIPDSLLNLLKWIIVGPKSMVDLCPKKKEAIDTSVQNISQIVMGAVKTDRQSNNQSSDSFYNRTETPFTAGLGLHMHYGTRSRDIVDTLADLNLSIKYEKVIQIENDIAETVKNNMLENNGLYLPPNLKKDVPIHFAIDNSDFENDTPDGKNEFHGTVMVAFQKCQNESAHELQINRSKARNLQFDKNLYEAFSFNCNAPKPPKEHFPNFSGIPKCDELELYTKRDKLWAISYVLNSNVPTWAGYNSLLNESMAITSCNLLPLLPSSPTDWSNLYSALKIVQGINISITGNRRTIITLDLQLYAKCMQLREKKEIKDNFIFRLGELHTVFAMLKVLGKYIAQSGLDRLFIEARIYGPTTLGKVLEGKDMKLSMEAFMVLYLALTSLLIKESGIDMESTKSELESSIQRLQIEHNIIENSEVHKSISNNLKEISKVLETVTNSLDNQGLYLSKFMEMYEVFLLFVRASRQGLWQLHLSSLNEFTKFFFSFDQINYARMSPLYLATMHDLQTSDKESWSYLEQNYSIFKSPIPFVGIGSDHAIEQENKVLKVTGGIIGLTQNQSTLNRYCISSPVLSHLSNLFIEKHTVSRRNNKRKHYQLVGSINLRIHQNVEKMVSAMNLYSVTFEPNECVYNVVSRAVLPKDDAANFLRHCEIGLDLMESFIQSRLKKSETSVWDPMKKCALKTFKAQMKKTKTRIQGKLIELKEEKNLITKFLLAARKRPELKLEETIGEYEFSVVPRSLFTCDGQPHHCTDKSKLMHHIEDLPGVLVQSSKFDVQSNFIN